MQEVITKKTEIVKINGKRFLAEGESVREFTKEDEKVLLNKLVDCLLLPELKKVLKLYSTLQQDEEGNQYFQVFSQDKSELDDKRFYLKDIYVVSDPLLIGQDTVEGATYFICYNNSEVWSFYLTEDGDCHGSFKNITDDLIDGKLIK